MMPFFWQNPMLGNPKRKKAMLGVRGEFTDVKASQVKPGVVLWLERRPVLYRPQTSAGRLSYKTVAAVKTIEDSGDLILRFKGVKIPGHKNLQAFRGTVVKGKLVEIWAGGGPQRPVKYDVLGMKN